MATLLCSDDYDMPSTSLPSVRANGAVTVVGSVRRHRRGVKSPNVHIIITGLTENSQCGIVVTL